MIAPTTTLFAHPLRTASGDFDIMDVVFDPSTGRAPFLIVDMGGLLSQSHALVSMTQVTGFAADGDAVMSTLSSDDVQSAPVLETDGPVIDTTALPPVVIGPFGTTQSPLLLAAQLFGVATESEDALPARFERATDWIGAAVFGPDGETGKIGSFDINIAGQTIDHVVIGVEQADYSVPFSALRAFKTDERYVVSDLTAEDLRAGITAAPAGPAPKSPPRSWIAA